MDFSHYENGGRYYAGSERKISVVAPDGTFYMLKFPKKHRDRLTSSHVCEYLGSKIFDLSGLSAQEVKLGTYKGEEVVVCRDFNESGFNFVPFNDVGESSIDDDKEKYQYEYGDIMSMLEHNIKLTNLPETVSIFWRMYIVDALIGNFDRHGSNWGFLKKDNQYKMAPIFDNGSCLYPRLIQDSEIVTIRRNPAEIRERLFVYPTSQIKLNGNKSSYFEVINSCQYEECNRALVQVIRTLNMTKVHELIEEVPFISNARRSFLHYMIDQRYNRILLDSYNKLSGSL